ncbi:967_t:CDS:2, partial [Cetraspora pellucida]
KSIAKIRMLMAYLKSSKPTNNALKRFCNIKSITYLKPEIDVKTRWNSTYYMLMKWKKLEPALNLLIADDQMVKEKYLDMEDLHSINDTIILLEPIEHATRFLSASSYPTHGDVRIVVLSIREHLSRYKNNTSFSKSQVADAMYQKLKNYWSILDASSQISAFLDPRVKISAFKTEYEKNTVINLISGLNEYLSEVSQQTILTDDSTNDRDYFRNLYTLETSFSSINCMPLNCIYEEIKKYLAIPLLSNVDPLCWWQTQHLEYPTLSIIACDYLPIQATSVASEQAFSIAGKTITEERNKLDEETARAILCLKSWIRKE